MYRFELSKDLFTPIAIEELQEIHDTRKKMIFTELENIFCKDFSSLTCVDIACNEGFFSFELIKKNIRKVIGFDAREINIKKANLIKNYFRISNADFFVADINNIDTNELGKFDIVFLLGLLYHVENPLGVLRKTREMTGKVCVIDTQVIPFNASIRMGWGLKGKIQETSSVIGLVQEKLFEKNIAGSVTGLSFVPNKEALFMMLKYAGFSEIELIHPPPDSHEQYLNYDRIIVFAK